MKINKRMALGVVFTSVLSLNSLGCGLIPETEAQEEKKAPSGVQTAAVDVAIARRGSMAEVVEYIGTTQPVQEVSLRSQVQGQLLNLTVDVGDRVTKGQPLVQLDNSLLQAVLSQAEAELATQASEVIRAQGEVNEALSAVESAKVQLEQAKIDADRLRQLFEQGAIAKREVELADTQYRTAKQVLVSAQSQVNVRKSAVAVAQGRVNAQKSLIKQEQERLSYSSLASPISGYVLQRVLEPGNLVQPGSEIVRLGDFSQVKVVVPVTELALANIKVGQSVKVRLDAFPRDSVGGRVQNISPAADPTARQVPIEVIIPNPQQKIGSGLLARVSFSQEVSQPVVIPETALNASRKKAIGRQGTIFIVKGDKDNATVSQRNVTLGKSKDGYVEILQGISPGERFVSRSSRPLKENESVRLSVLSE